MVLRLSGEIIDGHCANRYSVSVATSTLAERYSAHNRESAVSDSSICCCDCAVVLVEGDRVKRGRPKIELDVKMLEGLAKIGCTDEEMATLLGVSSDTLVRNYAESIKRGRAEMKMSLRRLQIKLAEEGNATMAIWLGKQNLGQKDKVEHAADANAPMVLKVVYESKPVNSETAETSSEAGYVC